MRKPLIAGNWKMYKTIPEALELVKQLRLVLDEQDKAAVVVCPVFTALSSVSHALSGSRIQLGAQDLFWEKEGAFTGAISAPMVQDAGCRYVIIGHSERRKYFAETDETVNKKVKAALSENLIPILCVGETLQERQAERTLSVVSSQIKGGFSAIPEHQAQTITIAYEPVWAIGTGVNATPVQAEEVHSFIRKLIGELYGSITAERVSILYGGSVKPENISELMAEHDIDGALVGGASLKAESFIEIVKQSTE